MRRREFVGLVGGAAAVWPFAALAQQAAAPVVGFLGPSSAQRYLKRLGAFREGLSEIGYVEGQNVEIVFRSAEDQNDRLPALAADLVHRQVAVIVAAGSETVQAVKAATTTIPIVFNIGIDPVAAGIATSLARPGGNLTGVTSLSMEVTAKRLELLHELMPTTTIVALLVNPTNPNAESLSRNLEVVARAIGLQLHVIHASTEAHFDMVFTKLNELRAGALLIGTDGFLISRSEQLATLTLLNAVPAIFQYREFAAAGGLMSYGGSITDQYRQLGVYTGRILKGEKPANLPVHQSTKIELIINLKTAKALGITIPDQLLRRADEVIE